jgi:hypothetical protein
MKNKMNINQETINKIDELYAELDVLNIKKTELINTAKIDSENKCHMIERDGKLISISERDLWDELYWTGKGGEKLKEAYPQVFEVELEAIKKSDEIRDYALKYFGFNPEKMTLSSLLKIIDGIVEIRLQNHVK